MHATQVTVQDIVKTPSGARAIVRSVLHGTDKAIVDLNILNSGERQLSIFRLKDLKYGCSRRDYLLAELVRLTSGFTLRCLDGLVLDRDLPNGTVRMRVMPDGRIAVALLRREKVPDVWEFNSLEDAARAAMREVRR